MSTSHKFDVVDALLLVTSGNDSELSELSSDEDDETYQPEERGCALEDVPKRMYRRGCA
jgi:hypothetical protein